ncbi:hypothetical protein CCACVL1_17500 [Corchorus capsularis]|uniref:Uncharacterized protein n=1 Tax=Corchorus capsularis TaxID=210143 RepID=A0A1R3HRK7_COCAP|nr:hypothetical protein CCACVL1_17500 [Corchorus capsularis]
MEEGWPIDKALRLPLGSIKLNI